MPLSNQGTASTVPPASSRYGGVKKPNAKAPPRKPLGNVDNTLASRSCLPKYPSKRPAPEAPAGQEKGPTDRRTAMQKRASANANRRATGKAPTLAQKQSVTFTSKRSASATSRRTTQADFAQTEKPDGGPKGTDADERTRLLADEISQLREAVLDGKTGGMAQIEKLLTEKGALESKLAHLEGELAGKVTELGKVQIALAAEEQARKNVGEHNSEVVDSLSRERDKNSALEHQLKSLSATIAALETNQKFMDERLAAKQAEIDKLTAECGEHEKLVSKLKAEKDDSVAACTRVSASNAELEERLELGNSKLREKCRVLADTELENVSKDAELRKLRTTQTSLDNEIATLTAALASEKDSVTNMRSELRSALDKAEAKAREYEQEVSNVRRTLQSRIDELAQKNTDVEAEKARTESSLQKANADLEGAKADVAQFRSTVSAQDSAMVASKSQADAIRIKLEAESALSAERLSKITELEEMLKSHKAEIEVLEEQAHVDEEERRRLHNALQELKGNIRVFCRVRPPLSGEVASTESGADVFSYTNKSRGVCAENPVSHQRKTYNFDRVFGPASTQEDVFGEISQLVQSALDGYRVCIFAYGQTGSGKTHTIMGSDDCKGMIPRSVDQIFERAQRLEKDQWHFRFKASFLEIYNEEIRDLLGASGACKAWNGKPFQVSNLGNEGKMSLIPGLTIAEVSSPEAATKLFEKARKNRATAATRSNSQSSRSHSVFRLFIEAKNTSSGQSLDGILNLVDLAGSERVKASGAEGARLKETQNINKSLTQLSVVIQALANKASHVPYRSSMLTKVLQDSLGGDSKALMFVNVAPTPANFSESTSALSFAERVNACEIGVANRSTKIVLTEDE